MLNLRSIFVMILCLVILSGGCASNRWSDAKSTDSIQAYREFLTKYPRSEHRWEATKRMHALSYEKAAGIDTKLAYGVFLKGPFAKGIHNSQAKKSLAEIEDAEVEQIFAEARKVDTIEAYNQFIKAHPSHRNVDPAQKRIEAITWSSAEKENTVASYQQYLKKYRWGHYKAEANAHISKITAGIAKIKLKEWESRKQKNKQPLAESVSSVVVGFKKEIDTYNKDKLVFVFNTLDSTDLSTAKGRPATREELLFRPSKGNDVFVVATVVIKPKQSVTFYPRENAVLVMADGSQRLPIYIDWRAGKRSRTLNPSGVWPPYEKYDIDLDSGTQTELHIRFEVKKSQLTGAKLMVIGKQYDIPKP